MNVTDLNTSAETLWKKRKRHSSECSDMSGNLVSLKSPRMNSSFYITLAKESPQRIYESDISDTYDDRNEIETDFCKDTSDYLSSEDEENTFATMEVLEYEVASESSSDGGLYSNDSSSGTDEMMIAAVARALYEDSTSSSDFGLFADTEESDGSSDDPELGRADYWECIKCKNRQNNPMYRYCEKCYQIRKNYFPPRPKMRKSRESLKRRAPIHNSSEDYSSSDELCNSSGKRQNIGKTNNLNQSKNVAVKSINSAGESTTDDLSDIDSNLIDKKSPLKIENPKDCILGEKSQKINNSTKGLANSVNISCNNISRKRSHENVNEQVNEISKKMKTIDEVEKGEEDSLKTNIQNKLFKNVLENCSNSDSDSDNKISTVNPPSHLNLTESQKDSGFSSSSSQELFPILDEIPKQVFPTDTQETFCKELENQNSQNLIESKSIDSCSSGRESIVSSPLPIVVKLPDSEPSRSNSSCSELNPTIYDELTSQQKSLDSPSINGVHSNLNLFDAQGPCIICLSQPKNGVFVHSRFLHSCCCYKCAVKIWTKCKRCPVCNCKVKNVMKLFVS